MLQPEEESAMTLREWQGWPLKKFSMPFVVDSLGMLTQKSGELLTSLIGTIGSYSCWLSTTVYSLYKFQKSFLVKLLHSMKFKNKSRDKKNFQWLRLCLRQKALTDVTCMSEMWLSPCSRGTMLRLRLELLLIQRDSLLINNKEYLAKYKKVFMKPKSMARESLRLPTKPTRLVASDHQALAANQSLLLMLKKYMSRHTDSASKSQHGELTLSIPWIHSYVNQKNLFTKVLLTSLVYPSKLWCLIETAEWWV